MKNRTLHYLGSLILATIPSLSFAKVTPTPIHEVAIPGSFDDNDNVEIFLIGSFPNTCFKEGPVKYEVDEVNNVINISSQSYNMDNSRVCIPVQTPFFQVVKVGTLKAGSYKVQLSEHEEMLSKDFTVKQSPTPDMDEYIYAPVKGAYLMQDKNADNVLVLSGRFPSLLKGCMVLESVAVSYESGVIVVQPKAKLVDECPNDYSVDFVAKKVLRKDSGEHKVLHVRAMNGMSVNRLIENYSFAK